jgi:hypothetical protein
VDTVYFHRFPFVYGRGFTPEELKKLVHDFEIRYIWTDTRYIETVQENIPEAVLILKNDPFFVFELSMK